MLTELYRTVDIAVLLVVIAAVLVMSNADRMPNGGLGEFFRLRVTLKNALLVVLVAFAWQKVFFLAGLYEAERIRDAWSEQVTPIIAACTLGCLCAFAFPVFSNSGSFGYVSVGYVWLGVTVSTLATRFIVQAIAARSSARGVRRVLVIGTGPRARLLESELARHDEAQYRVVGFVESNDFTPHPDVSDRTLGTLDELENILMHHVVDEVVIALPVRSCYGQIQRVIEDCERSGVPCLQPVDVFRSSLATPRYQMSAPFPAISVPVTHDDDHRRLVKRVIDLVGGVIGVCLFSPVMLIIALTIKLNSQGPIIFAQQRIGFRKRSFRMFKFRTMVANAEALQASLERVNEASGPVFKIRHDPRITRFGRFLRRTSLDELPQFFNVIRGEMSLVGPRPLPVRDVGHFAEPWLMRRFSVLPGLTCLWQIQGRSQLGFDDWVALDLKYIDEWSLALDCRILLKTIPAVLRARGAS
jgi:exopolysaccharide biosynthesis polyprenyl glycosylphosphotransferase